jgi:hypothetical protein
MVMLHLVKLCVGATSIEDLAAWQSSYSMFQAKHNGGKRRVFHTTFQSPKRQMELLDGGSLYWVIKGLIQARQKLIGFDEGTKEDGSACCLLLLDPDIVPVRPTPRKAFQGWRYLTGEDAPADIGRGASKDLQDLPAKMRKDLAALGLL